MADAADQRVSRTQTGHRPPTCSGRGARQARWRANRHSVPYWTDGPKVTLGVLWFLLIVGGALLGYVGENPRTAAVAVALVGGGVAALAALQTGFAWFPNTPATRSWTAAAAFLTTIAGFYGPWGVPIGAILGALTLSIYLVLYRGHRRKPEELMDVLARSALPAGIAMGSLAALCLVEPGGLNAALALILMVSAYEVGDFLVGSGSSNALEGPLAGVISLGVVAFFLFLLTPEPFTSSSALLAGGIAAVCCPLGQIFASALLPHGTTWAPALRRIDSYLLSAPLWLALMVLLPGINS